MVLDHDRLKAILISNEYGKRRKYILFEFKLGETIFGKSKILQIGELLG